MRWGLVAIVAISSIGCYAPSARPGAACANGECPAGLVCSPATHTCELHAVPAGDASNDTPIDSAIDAGVADAADAALPTAMLVQQTTSYSANASTLSATLPATPATGHVLLMIGATPSGPLASVSGGGVTWTRAASSLINSNIELWYGITSGTSATVTINRPNNAAPMWLLVTEWSGLATATTLDQATVADGTVGPVSAGSITTTNARDLVVFAASAYAPSTFGTPAPGTWAPLAGIANTAITQLAWYRLETATGTFAPAVTQSGGPWDAVLAGFRMAP